jgi:hypothetical protein
VASVAAVQVLTGSSISILAPVTGDTRASRGPIMVSNLGPNTIYLGTSSGVTTATGYPVPTLTSVTVSFIAPTDTLYARAATADQASPADTRVLVGR